MGHDTTPELPVASPRMVFLGTPVRVAVQEDGAQLYVLNDIAKALGYSVAENFRRQLDPAALRFVLGTTVTGLHKMLAVSREDAFAVALRTRTPEARKLQAALAPKIADIAAETAQGLR